MSIVSILVAVAVFFVIVVLHEFGHFAVAKLCGVTVNTIYSQMSRVKAGVRASCPYICVTI